MIPAEAFDFYAALEADNSRVFWLENKQTYEEVVRAPLIALCEAVDERFKPFRLFRPHRDVRFSADKSPYKTNQGAISEALDGQIYYLHIDSAGLLAASGYYAMAADQLARYRVAVDSPAGADLQAAVQGLQLDGIESLKTVPRGFDRDHPRRDLLRRKGIAVFQRWEPAAWMGTPKVVSRIEATWRSADPLNAWLGRHVGPSTLPPRGR